MSRRPTRLRLTALEDRLTPAGGLETFAAGSPMHAAHVDATPPPVRGPADLDPTFGTDGRAALRPVTPGDFIYPDVSKVISLSSGKSLVIGRLDGFFVQRLNADGTPDATFGVNGRAALKEPEFRAVTFVNGFLEDDIVATDPRTQITSIAAATATPDGGVLIVGTANSFLPDGFYGTMRVFKLTSSGALDTAYTANANAAGGFAPRDDGTSGSDLAAGVVATPDGRVVIAGTTGSVDTHESGSAGRAAVLRLRADGTLDTTFGVGGRVTFGTETVSNTDPARPFPDAKQSVGLRAVALDHVGRILVAGSVTPLLPRGFTSVADIPTYGVRAFAARLTAAGALDTSFDSDGVASITGSKVNDAAGGWIGSGAYGAVVVGLGGSSGQFAIARLTADGQTDTAYGVGGFSELSSAIGSVLPVVDVVISPAGATLVATLHTIPGRKAGQTPGATDAPDSYFVALEQVAQDGKTVRRYGEIQLANTGEAVNGRYNPAVAVDDQSRVTVAGGVPSAADPRVVVARLAERLVVYLTELPYEPPVIVTVKPQPVKVPGDVNGDGVADNIVTDGPRVSVVSGSDGRVLVKAFAPFEASYTGALNAVFVDVDGDGRSELVVSPGQGGGPVVAVYNADGMERGRFWGIDDAGFRGGVNLAAGDVNGDARPDLVVTAGAGGGPRVAIYDGKSLGADARRLVADFFAFEATQTGGATAGLANGVLIFGAGPGGGPRVRGVNADGLFATGGVKSLDDLPAAARRFDRFAGDTSARKGVALDFSGVDHTVTDRPGKVTADSGDGNPVTVYEYPGFGPAV